MTPRLRVVLAALAATASGCWLFETPTDLTHPISAGAGYWAPCQVYLTESVKSDSARPKNDPDLHNQAWLDCIERQHNAKKR